MGQICAWIFAILSLISEYIWLDQYSTKQAADGRRHKERIRCTCMGFASWQNNTLQEGWFVTCLLKYNYHAKQQQYDLAEEDVYALGVWFVKTAILLFYLRLNPEKRFRQMTYAIMGFVAFYSLLSILIFTLGCNPVQAMWDVTIKDAKCVDQFAFVYANAAFNVFSDLVTLLLPIKICWSLQTSVRQRMLLMIVFGTGSL